MKLSFVIPAYNEENYIADCLNSILKQTKDKDFAFEIIVVNNASTDRTAQVAAAFPGVKVVDEPKKGLSQARHSGFLASSGELIANIDADTILPAGWIETVLSEFEKNPRLVGLSGPYIYHDLSFIRNLAVRFFYCMGFISYLVNRFVLRVSSMMQGGNFVVKRAALETIGGFNVGFKFYGEDTDIAHRLSRVGDVKFTFKLPMYTSGRRLAHEGLVRVGLRYAANHIWTILFKKPLTKKYIDVRKP